MTWYRPSTWFSSASPKAVAAQVGVVDWKAKYYNAYHQKMMVLIDKEKRERFLLEERGGQKGKERYLAESALNYGAPY